MRRRALLASVPAGVSIVGGCLDLETETGETDDDGAEDTAADAPTFEVDEDAPGTVTLLRIQPQTPGGITEDERFEIAIVLGNAGGESVSGDVGVDLVPPIDDAAVQTATAAIDDLPSGGAGFFTTGPFEATVSGDWELIAGSGIDRVHPEYDGTVDVGERPDD